MTAKKMIFLVDDNPTNLTIGKAALIGKYNVITIPSGQKLLNLLEKTVPDLILLDVEMPEMNGVEAFQAIRAIRRDVPIIVMSGYGDSASRERFNLLDPAAFLSKPFTGNELLAVLAGIAVHDAPKD